MIVPTTHDYVKLEFCIVCVIYTLIFKTNVDYLRFARETQNYSLLCRRNLLTSKYLLLCIKNVQYCL